MKTKIIILGAGFAGMKLARKLKNADNFDITILDKNNYHQFQPLLYQVATSGLEPWSIIFPLRKALQKEPNIHIRWGEVTEIDTANKQVITTGGTLPYDKLVIALGADNNFFGNKQLEQNCLTMKSISEALLLRNELLTSYELAVSADEQERQRLLTTVIVGGGATGVELAGTIAEMKNNILHKDYPEVDFAKMRICLVEAGDRLLPALSSFASKKALQYLQKLGVEVLLNTMVKSYDGQTLETSAVTFDSKCVIWAAGIKAARIKGIPDDLLGRAGRIKTDVYNRVADNIYAIGDISIDTSDERYPGGHPQVAPVAIQQATTLADNLIAESRGKHLKPFKYKNNGSMATVGRNLAVVELPNMRFGGFFAWLVWMFVHLMSILGVRNKSRVLMNWVWNYINYDASLRLILRMAERKKVEN